VDSDSLLIHQLPLGQGDHTAVYNSSTNRMTIFSGLIAQTLFTNDVWVLSHANGQ